MSEPAIEYPPLWEGRTTKLSVTVPESLVAVVRQHASAGNVSGYGTEALIRQIELDRLGELVQLLAERPVLILTSDPTDLTTLVADTAGIAVTRV